MKVENESAARRDLAPVRSAPMPSLDAGYAPPSFSSALQQQRQYASRAARETRENDSGASRAAPRQAATSEGRPLLLDIDEPSSLEGLGASKSLLSLLARSGDSGAQVAAGSPAFVLRRRTQADGPTASTCIEVSHAGIDFVLSKQNGVWLVSLKELSSLSQSELASCLEGLREQFAQRGLGEVDVIV